MDENSTKRDVFKDSLNNQKQQWKLWQQRPKKIEKTNFKKVSINNFHETKKWMVTKSAFVKQTKSHQKQDLTKILRSIFLPWWIRAAKIPSNKSCVLKQKTMTLATKQKQDQKLSKIEENSKLGNCCETKDWQQKFASQEILRPTNKSFETKDLTKSWKIRVYATVSIHNCVYMRYNPKKHAYTRVHMGKLAYICFCNLAKLHI